MTTKKKRKIANRLLFQISILFTLGFSIASCSGINPDVFIYPNATIYDGSDVGVLWRKVLPPSGGVMTTYDGKAYTTTSSLDDIILYYQRSLTDWNYLGRGTNKETTIEGASWKKNDDVIKLYYLAQPDRPCCFLLVLHTHIQRPIYTKPLFILGSLIIILALILIIFKKRLQKE